MKDLDNPVKHLKPQDWMLEKGTQAVMAALNQKGRFALFVGGCVRNALLAEEVLDVDIATKHCPETVMHMLKEAGIKTVPTGVEHGTVTAICEGRSFEITTLREDVKTDGRHAQVAFSDDWLKDAQRRDFTMNTLLMDEGGAVYDPLGQGLADLQARKICFVGDPLKRIREDYLRVLRFFRFYATYGQGEPDPEGLSACRQAGEQKQLDQLSRERITQEFLKILGSDKAAETVCLMFSNSVLDDLKLPDFNEETLRHVCTFQKRYGLRQISARLYILAGMNPDHISRFSGRLLLPKVFIKDMQAIYGALALDDLDGEHNVKVAVYKYGRVASAQALMISLALDRVSNGFAPKALEIIQKWEIPTFPVRGQDLIKQGFVPSPALGEKLESMEEEWIAKGFQTTDS